jgi:hypothetical protein
MAHSRFTSLDENDLSKLLADKDIDSTKEATKETIKRNVRFLLYCSI